MAIERVRGRRAQTELIDYLVAREPETTGALAVMRRPGSKRRRKAWIVRRDGSIAGVLVSARYCFDRWTGILLLPDLSCAKEMASALDRSNLWAVAGPRDGVEKVLRHARRGRGLAPLWLHSTPPTGDRRPPAGSASAGLAHVAPITVRKAVAGDVRSLVALYSVDNHLSVPRRRLRGTVRGVLHDTLVAESANRVVGAIVSSAAGEYTIVNRVVVDLTLRDGRLALTLAVSAAQAAIAHGRGVCGFRPGPSSPPVFARALGLSPDDRRAATASAWANAALVPPKRFRGQNRLRGLLERLEGGVA